MHLANLLAWTEMTLQSTELDLEPPGGSAYTAPAFRSPSETLATFDHNVVAARAALARASDQDLMVSWTLKKAGQNLFTMPRVACLRSFVLNHLIHHRGQLSVYLRLCDVPVPSIYGPTADEAMG
jgi:uncharacterized damage-inducible protein DinB